MFNFKSFLKFLVVFLFVSCSAYITYDFLGYKKAYNEASKKLVTHTANDILLLNINLKNKISQLLIDELDLFIKLSDNPENTEYNNKIIKLFKQYLPSFHTFSLADKQGEIMTDIFFEKVGRLCRQDIKQFALHESNTWLTIHPGLGKYHYDLILPWQYANTQKIMFISFDIKSLVKILKNNKRANHELFLVRKDKDNLIELSSAGSRAEMAASNDKVFLDNKQLKSFSQDIKNTYWTVIELPDENLLNFYLKELYNKISHFISYQITKIGL